jgi:cytidylate kinase
MSARPFVIAIDGPAASGKTTVAQALADRLGALVLDTGLLYRALTWLALRRGVRSGEVRRLAELAKELRVKPAAVPGRRMRVARVLVGEEDVTDRLADAAVEAQVSAVARLPQVRAALLEAQRRVVSDVAVIAGRDIGTAIFPDAPVKVFLLASPEVRAGRRVRQRREHTSAEVAEVLRAIVERDRNDAGQSAAADDAVLIETDGRTVEQVVDQIEAIVRARAGW